MAASLLRNGGGDSTVTGTQGRGGPRASVCFIVFNEFPFLLGGGKLFLGTGTSFNPPPASNVPGGPHDA